MILHSE